MKANSNILMSAALLATALNSFAQPSFTRQPADQTVQAHASTPASPQFQYQRLKSFGNPRQSGGGPNGVIVARDGRLYGMTVTGGSNNTGIAFKCNLDGTGYTALHYFTGSDGDGTSPLAGLIEGSDGALYGVSRKGYPSSANPVTSRMEILWTRRDGS